MKPLEQILADLVAINSVNPSMDPSAAGGEQAVCEYLRSLLEREGVPCEMAQVLPGRPNLYARLDLGLPRTLLLTSHTDVVPAEDFVGDPFTPETKDGHLCGRGSCDTKCNLAAMASAAAHIASSPSGSRFNLVFAAVCDEESGFAGSKAAAARFRADLAIVGEPTRLRALNRHKGVARFQLQSTGKSCHSSVPHLGTNAIYIMSGAIAALEHLNAEWAEAPGDLAPRTVAVTIVSGGQAVNIVPDSCRAEIDVRLLPTDDSAAVADEIRSVLPPDVDLLPPFLDAPGLFTDPSLPLVEELCLLTGQPLAAAPFATDAAFFSATGTPAIVLGAGDGLCAHTSDERVELAQVEQYVMMLREFICRAA